MLRLDRYSLGIIFAAVALLLAHPADSRSEELRYKFEPGQKLRFDVALNMSLAFSGEGLPDQSMTLEQITEMVWTVDSVDEDGTATIHQTIERMQMKVAAPPNVEFEYDSDSDDLPTGSTAAKIIPLVNALVGAAPGESDEDAAKAKPAFEMTMNPRGEVLEVTVPETVSEALEKSSGAGAMGEMFTEEGFKKMVQQGSPALPEGSVEPGDEWTHQFALPGRDAESRQTITTTYRYLGEEQFDGRPLDGIAVEMVVDGLLAAVADTTGAEVTVKSQESSGKMYFDREAGRMHASSIDMTMDMEIAALNRIMNASLQQDVQVKVTPLDE